MVIKIKRKASALVKSSFSCARIIPVKIHNIREHSYDHAQKKNKARWDDCE